MASQQRARPKLLFLVTEDWYFWSHRLPVARAAHNAGFEVLVATRVRTHEARITGEGFRLCSLAWRRRGDGVLGGIRAVAAIAALYRRERPDIVHHVALKPALFGAAALRLAFPLASGGPACVAAIAGLGSGFALGGMFGRAARSLMLRALAFALRRSRIIVQNPDDGHALSELGIPSQRITLIRGSGVDTARFAALPDPAGRPVKVALVSRMLHSKGVPEAVAAVSELRARGLDVELLLVGPVDPDNSDSLTETELASIAATPEVRWSGPVEDIPAMWREAAIAVLPSTYGEGVPKALIEAASCARPIVTTDTPGCRDIVRDGETGLLVPPGDVAALADAIGVLVADPQRRAIMGRAGRELVERLFAEETVARQTLALYHEALQQRGRSV